MTFEHVLGRPGGHLREHRTPTRQLDARRTRKVESVKPEVQEEAKYAGAPGHGNRYFP